MKANRDKGAEDLIQAVVDDVNRFSEDIQYDDVTLIVVRVLRTC
ncbi:MAG: hypothetical protein U5K31_09420 [Balneolaceae bacterium]|nr:hypothetical protein [Balneolaceae bacterium]